MRLRVQMIIIMIIIIIVIIIITIIIMITHDDFINSFSTSRSPLVNI